MTIEEMNRRKRELGYSNETLAKKSGVPMTTVQKVLSGKTKSPRQKTVEALARVLEGEKASGAASGPVPEQLREGVSEELPYRVEDGAVVKRVDYYEPSVRGYMVRESAIEYGKKRKYTMDDIRALPPEIWAELIDGEMVFRGAPSRTHQRINGGMHLAVANFLLAAGKDCEVYIPPYGVFIWGDETEYFLPDLTVFCDHSKSEEDGCIGAPDWVVEIISPSTKKMDYGKKLRKYRGCGVKLYWIIDPVQKMTVVFRWDGEEEEMELHPFDEEIECALCPELKIRIADML